MHTLAHAMFRLIFLEGDYQKTRPAIISILSETQLTKKITQAQRDNDCEVYLFLFSPALFACSETVIKGTTEGRSFGTHGAYYLDILRRVDPIGAPS